MSEYRQWSNAILRAFVLLFIFAISGCTGPALRSVIADLGANPAHGVLIEAVPFFPQAPGELMCGPAALASVIGYYRGTAQVDSVAREVYHEKLKGTFPVDLFIYAKELGFGVEYYKGGLEDLKLKLSESAPLILYLNLGIEAYPVGHYVVAVGYNDELGVVLAHSGLERMKVYGYERLLGSWGKTGFATLLVTGRPDHSAKSAPKLSNEDGP